jgi:hypothetical protein
MSLTKQCCHGDARCSSDVYGMCTKRATWGYTHMDGSKSFTLHDYSPSISICDFHYELWAEDRYYKDDKGYEPPAVGFGRREMKPQAKGSLTPGWARRVNSRPRPARKGLW